MAKNSGDKNVFQIKQTSQYRRAEDYIPKFARFLLEKHAIKDNKIDKEQARNIFLNEFKPKFGINKFSFSALNRHLRYFRITQRNKQNDYLIFKSEFLLYVTSDTNNLANKRKFNVIPILKSQKKSTVQHSAPKTEPANVPVTKDTHKKTSITVGDRYEFLKKNLNKQKNKEVVVEIIDERGEKIDQIIANNNQSREVFVNVINTLKDAYSIVNVEEVRPITNVKIHSEPKLPCLLKEFGKVTFKLNVLFGESIFYTYALIFHLKHMKNEKEICVFKELTFHIHSHLVDDLRPTRPYTKIINRLNFDAVEVVDAGQQFGATETVDFQPLFFLPRYNLPDNLTILINNDFKQFADMTPQQKNLLKKTEEIFKVARDQGLTSNNYYNLLELLLYLEEHQMKIDVRTYDRRDQTLKKLKGSRLLELEVPGLAEHRPSILRGDSVFIKESLESTIKYEGIVHNIKQTSVHLAFSKKFRENVFIENKKFFVSFTFNRIPLRAEHQAIDLLRKHNSIHFFFPTKLDIRSLENYSIVWKNQNIENNAKQQQAVKQILSKTSFPSPYLIFGPPGTGKTVTVVEAVMQIYSLKELDHVLICTPCNASADDIAKRLLKCNMSKRHLLRYVAPSYNYNSIPEEVLPCVNYNKDHYFHPPIDVILNYRIVITTLITASRLVNGGTPINHFNYVFIDESGQATESETLIPFAGILTCEQQPSKLFGQVVLVGDPKQLGPIIHSKKAVEYGFETSMLERLMSKNSIYQKNDKGFYNEQTVTKLIYNYRSHPAILELPNKLFYDHELVSQANKESVGIAENWEHLPNKSFPIIFHSVFGKDDREENSPSFFNLQELEVVVSYLEKLIGNRLQGKKISKDEIGIITPYHKQVQKLKTLCSKKNWSNMRIGTVEQFQGDEKLIIIVSTVRCKPEFLYHDEKFHLGFLRNPKRFNVAITRAKALLIVVGDPRILQFDTYWRALIKYCKNNDGFCGNAFDFDPRIDLPNESSVSSNNNDVCNNGEDETPNFMRGNV